MQSPPPFAPPVRKNNNTVLIVVLVILGVFGLCCVGLVFLGFGVFNKMKGLVGCTLNYAYTEEAVNRYVAAKHKYPPAATWQDDIMPYWSRAADDRQAGKIFDMSDPSKDLGCKAGDSGPATGMSYNSNVAGKAPSKVSPSTVILFEVPTTGRNQASPYKKLEGRSPQGIFGRQRPWATITADGHGTFTNRSSGFSDTSVNSDNSPPDLGKDADDSSGQAPAKKSKKPANDDSSD